jgi:hypothetical protein
MTARLTQYDKEMHSLRTELAKAKTNIKEEESYKKIAQNELRIA